MIIQCPRCSTRWRADDDPESDNPVFKCGRCHHTWRLFPGAPDADERGSGSARGRAAANGASDNLEFIFPGRSAARRDVAAPEIAARRGPSAAALSAASARAPRSESDSSPAGAVHDEGARGRSRAGTSGAETAGGPSRTGTSNAENAGVQSQTGASDAASAHDLSRAETPVPAVSHDSASASAADAAPTVTARAASAPPPTSPAVAAPPRAAREEPSRIEVDGDRDDEYVLGINDDEPDESPADLSAEDALDRVHAADVRAPDLDDELTADVDDDLTIAEPDDFGREDETGLELEDEDGDDDDDEADTAIEEQDGGRVLRLEDTMTTRAPTPALGAICRVLIALVVCYGLLAIVIRADPEQAKGWLARVPLLGATLGDDHALLRRVALRNLEGGYQRLHGAHRVFVILGEAVNNTSTTLERIEVAGAIYGDAGELDRKVVNAGNRTTVKLADLSESEIAYLQHFASRMTLAPGQSSRFAIVFLQPPKGVREFSSKVMSARPSNRAAVRRQPDRALDPASVG